MVLGGARHQGVAWGPKQELQELPRDSVAVREQMRRFGYYVPSRARAGAPIVIALHGTGGTGERLRRFTGGWLDSLAERHGFVVAYPDAMEGMWNTCRAAESAMASQRGVDDVAMISAVAQRLARRFGGDSTHVYALGYSGGGHLAYRLALEGPEVVRGVAIFAASLPVDAQLACRPSRGAVPIMIVSGTADVINPYEGGAVTGPFGQRLGDVRSAVATAAYFATRAGADTANVDETPGVMVSSRGWTRAGGMRVVLYTVNGGGHSIPGPHSFFPSLVGRTERSWSGIEEAVRFFGIGGTP
jgi:polyhydroxybutyrate depolymerase